MNPTIFWLSIIVGFTVGCCLKRPGYRVTDPLMWSTVISVGIMVAFAIVCLFCLGGVPWREGIVSAFIILIVGCAKLALWSLIPSAVGAGIALTLRTLQMWWGGDK